MSKSRGKAFELRRKAAELGSPKGLELYAAELAYDKRAPGFLISFDPKLLAEAKKLLYKSMELGNGDAGVLLYKIYDREKNSEGMINSLRAGAKLGSKECLLWLWTTFSDGDYGQIKDRNYAKCFSRLEESISDFEAPKPIPNFEKICPAKPIRPYKEWLSDK